MKIKTEEILKKLKELKELKSYEEIEDFILPLDLTSEQFEILSEDEDYDVRCVIAQRPDLPEDLKYKLSEDKDDSVRWAIAEHPDLPEDLMYKLAENDYIWVRRAIAKRPDLPNGLIIRSSCDSDYEWATQEEGFKKLENLNTLKSEDLENAYALIRTSKYISRRKFEKTFNYIIFNFPELSEAAKLLKSVILKGKKDLK
jgi:hypothetical protein